MRAESKIRFFSRPPRKELRGFIDVLWYFEGYELPLGRELALPTGTVELVISLHSDRSSDSELSGAHSKAFVIERSECDRLLGIHFKPGGAFPFLRPKLGELNDLRLSMDLLWGKEEEALRSELREHRVVERQFQVLENWLLNKSCRPLLRHKAVQYALTQLCGEHGPPLSMSELAEKAGLSQRRFIQVFRDEVGLTPKLFGRIQRLQRVLLVLATQNECDVLDLALSAGYFDKAHFQHDFKEFTGLTPRQYRERQTGHPNHVFVVD